MNTNQSRTGSPSSGVLGALDDRLAPLSPRRANFGVHPIATGPRRGSALYRAEADRLRQVRALCLTQKALDFGQSTETNMGHAGFGSTAAVHLAAVEGMSDCLVASAKIIAGICALLFALDNFGFPVMLSLLVVLLMLLS